MKNPVQSQFARFLLAGGIAAAANYLSRFLFSQFLPYVPAIVLSFVVGLVTGFLLMRLFVFLGGTGTRMRQASYYIIVNLAGLAITIIVSVVAAHLFYRVVPDQKFDEAAGHLIGVMSPIFVSFFAHKYLTFR